MDRVVQVLELQLVQVGHRSAVLAFELENRDYFATLISDRGDEYFAQLTERHNELLAEQDAGTTACYVLVEEDGTVVGRFNLYRIHDGAAEVGYRIAERIAGHGIATAVVQKLCQLAIAEHGLSTLRAATSDHNIASQRVLLKAGFVQTEPVAAADLGGKQGHWYLRHLNPEQV